MADQPPDHTAFSASPRVALRREKIAARLAMPAAAHREASARVLDHLAILLKPRPPGTIAFCWPIRAEVDCRPLIAELLAAGWHAAMPTVVAVAAPLRFLAWSPDMPMREDPHGIPVPACASPAVPDVLLLPLVAFDAAGYRLGYGGGYFDRTLEACVPRPLTIGIGFAAAAVTSIAPAPHDIPLDFIVTEAGIHRPVPLAAP